METSEKLLIQNRWNPSKAIPERRLKQWHTASYLFPDATQPSDHHSQFTQIDKFRPRLRVQSNNVAYTRYQKARSTRLEPPKYEALYEHKLEIPTLQVYVYFWTYVRNIVAIIAKDEKLPMSNTKLRTPSSDKDLKHVRWYRTQKSVACCYQRLQTHFWAYDISYKTSLIQNHKQGNPIKKPQQAKISTFDHQMNLQYLFEKHSKQQTKTRTPRTSAMLTAHNARGDTRTDFHQSL